MPHIYRWERVYKAAIDETDPVKRPERLLQAQQTILTRICELEQVSTRNSVNELAWLEKAVEGLANLQSGLLLNPVTDSTTPEPTGGEPVIKTKAAGST